LAALYVGLSHDCHRQSEPTSTVTDRFKIGDIVTRDGTDRQRIISTDADSPEDDPDLIEVECIQDPQYPWCRVGDREWNIPARYTLVPDVQETK
jgi:hypothetical protein